MQHYADQKSLERCLGCRNCHKQVDRVVRKIVYRYIAILTGGVNTL